MTKEELEKVIQHFKSLRIIQRESFMREGFDAVIKALEQEPCEDAISRAETVQFLTNHSSDFKDAKIRMTFKTASSLVNNPHNLPSITPIRPKGHWIKTNDYFTGAYESIDYVECSCCHMDSLEEGNYCPNCGAEMESEEK